MCFFFNFVSNELLPSLMGKKLIHIVLLLLFFSTVGLSQDLRQQNDALGFYPNPVSTGKIYITSKTNLDKQVAIFDVLGKKIFQATISSKELNISSIPPGIYIIKITEADAECTRKLIVR